MTRVHRSRKCKQGQHALCLLANFGCQCYCHKEAT